MAPRGRGWRRWLRWPWLRTRAAWRRLLATPEGPGRVSRGVAAGAFAGMVPIIGLHVAIAVVVAFVLRGSRPVAALACLLIGNPLVHMVEVPAAYGLGHWLLPRGAADAAGLLPERLARLLPMAEETVGGGMLIGVVVAIAAGLATRLTLAGRQRA